MVFLRWVRDWVLGRSLAEARARHHKAVEELDAALREVLRR